MNPTNKYHKMIFDNFIYKLISLLLEVNNHVFIFHKDDLMNKNLNLLRSKL